MLSDKPVKYLDEGEFLSLKISITNVFVKKYRGVLYSLEKKKLFLSNFFFLFFEVICFLNY